MYELILICYQWKKGYKGGLCHAIHQYVKANKKYMKDYVKNKKLSYLKYWDVNDLYGWKISCRCEVTCRWF